MWASVAVVICLTSLVKCATEPEYMTMAIGHLDNGVYPYSLHDDDTLTSCIKKETFEKHNNDNGTWSFWSSVRCLIEISSERKQGMNSIDKKYQPTKDKHSTTKELLENYCNRWTPKIDECFEASTSLLNDCDEKEPDKGYRSLFFGAAYMGYICKNKTKTLEHLFRDTESTDKISLGCFLELEDNIFDCIRTKAAGNKSTDFCTNFRITKSCFVENYETLTQNICNSTNYNESKYFVISLLKHIKSGLCKDTDTMNKKMMEHSAAKQTGRGNSDEADGEKKNRGIKNNAPSVSLMFQMWNLIFIVGIVSHMNLNIIMS